MEAFETLFSKFYDKVLKDDILAAVFAKMSPEHVQHVAHFVAEVFGGEQQYTTEDEGSHATMVARHLGKRLTEEQRKRWVHLLLETADETGLKSYPEFRSAFVGYLEWGSRIAVLNSNVTMNPLDSNAPMPRWGWGETGGPWIGEGAVS